ncbi:MAG: hypothetical protein ACYS0F_08800 [Planctomycetota bacterium]
MESRTGILVVAIGLAGLGAGFALGRFTADEPTAGRTARMVVQQEPGAIDVVREQVGVQAESAPAQAATREIPPVEPAELIDALRRDRASPRSQKMLIGMVADAARLGSEVLPDIRRLLESGDDITFAGYKPGEPGYPSLRVALLDAAAATGDPAAAELVAEVARTSESPVEVVFSAHVLDKLDALDAETAQRTLDSVTGKLSKEQMKAMGSILNQVVPRAAAADPGYAETILQQEIHNPARTKGELRRVTPMLDGLPLDRAKDVVLRSMTATDVSDAAKYQLAGRAARRPEVAMLQELRSAIESNVLDPKVSRTIAANAISGRPFSRARSDARKALKAGDIRGAQEYAMDYQLRLAEAAKTLQSARLAGAKIPPKYGKQASIHRENLNNLLLEIRRTHERMLKAARK